MPDYDRWPLVGAAALAPVSLAAIRRPALRPLAVLLWHQTEEWVWPGGFLPWINREILGSSEDEFPLDRRIGFAINVVFGWGTSLLAPAGPRAAAPAAMLYATHLGNAGLHLGWAARHRRYDPGAATAGALLGPLAVSRLAGLARDPRVPRRRRLALGALVLYLASPIDLVPDVIPVVGVLDDALLVVLVLRGVVRASGPDVLGDHWPGSPRALELVLRAAGR